MLSSFSRLIPLFAHPIIVTNHISPSRTSHLASPSLSPGITPCSDMSGQIVALGPPSSIPASFKLKVGDRVCANFAMPGFVFGDLGAHMDGVLAEYVVFEADVSVLVGPWRVCWEAVMLVWWCLRLGVCF